MNRILIIVLAGLLAACASTIDATAQKGQSSNPYIVDIYWKTNEPCQVDKVTEDKMATCMDAKPGFCVGRGKHIEWRSHNPTNAKYKIFFDPIKGPTLNSGGNGKIKKTIDQNAPIAKYKYSIVRDACKANEANTFDPHIRVDH